MLLLEAIQLRGELESQQSHIRQRLERNFVIQMGTQASEDPRQLIERMRKEDEIILKLTTAIALTNSATNVETKQGSKTLMEALMYRDYLSDQTGFLREMAIAALPGRDGQRSFGPVDPDEVAKQRTLDPTKLYTDAERLSQQRDELHLLIQNVNSSTVIEDGTLDELI